MIADMEKYNTAVLMGYRVLRYSASTIGLAVADIQTLLNSRGAKI
jgi:hypothetical protein